MTAISKDDVFHLARLSSLSIADDETEALQADLSKILNYVETLNELDTSGVEPTYQVTDLKNVWRDDVVRDDGVGRESLLDLAAASRDQQIEVPKVL